MFCLSSRRWFVLCLVCVPHLVSVQLSGDRDCSVDWAQLSRFYLKTETESSLRNTMFWNINRKMDYVQKYNICTKAPSSRTFRSYLLFTEFSIVTTSNVIRGNWNSGCCLLPLVSCLAYSSTEASYSFQTTRRYSRQDPHLHSQRSENCKSNRNKELNEVNELTSRKLMWGWLSMLLLFSGDMTW
jgi:hypothetical protein